MFSPSTRSQLAAPAAAPSRSPHGVSTTPGPHHRATPRAALDRTMRLMRDYLRPDVSDDLLLAALLDSRVFVSADAKNLTSPAAQTALVTTVLLLLRSGSTVVIDAPDVRCAGAQPPLTGDRIVSSLVDIGQDLIERVGCEHAMVGANDALRCTAVVLLGDTPAPEVQNSILCIRIGGDTVSGHAVAAAGAVAPTHVTPWEPTLAFPFGALLASGFAAAEVFKQTMRSLASWATGPATFFELFASSPETRMSLDPDHRLTREMLTPPLSLGEVDAVSGGAIVQSALFALARIPDVTGVVRVIEPECSDDSNLNRYALLRRSMLGTPKAVSMTTLSLGGLTVLPVVARYDRTTPTTLQGLADAVLVGVDHIPTRWAVQRGRPTWLGIGATSHYSAMSSAHVRGMPCAWCLHPTDSPDLGPIPSVAFVSHWGGVLLAWRLVLHRLGLGVAAESQYDYVTPLRLELPAAFWRSRIASRADCPHRCAPARRAA